MKNVIIICLLLTAISLQISAQNEMITREWEIGQAKEIKIESNYGDVVIKVWDQDKVRLEADVIINGQRENDALSIDDNKRSQRLSISTDTDFDKVPEMVTVRRKDGTRVFYSRGEYDEREDKNVRYTSTGYESDIVLTYWIPKNLAVNIETTYGNISIEDSSPTELYLFSTYGTIDAVFSNNTSLPDFRIKSTYGTVDLTVNDKLKADIEMHTSYGEILTNLNLDVKHNRNKNNSFGEDITGTLNGGGIDIILEATYGKVYLRSGE